MVGVSMYNPLEIKIVYDPDLESTESLEKFKFILSKALIENYVFITTLDYLNQLSTESVYNNFTIVLGKDTYDKVVVDFAKKLNIPKFEFCSRKYYEPSKKLIVYNLPLSVEDMFSSTYKQVTWDTIQLFVKYYNVCYEKLIKIKPTEIKIVNLEPQVILEKIEFSEQVVTSLDKPFLFSEIVSNITKSLSDILVELEKIKGRI